MPSDQDRKADSARDTERAVLPDGISVRRLMGYRVSCFCGWGQNHADADNARADGMAHHAEHDDLSERLR